MTATIKLRRDTAANWVSANPVLALAEPGLETDTDKLKIGDGVSTWTELAYFTSDILEGDSTNPPAELQDGEFLYDPNALNPLFDPSLAYSADLGAITGGTPITVTHNLGTLDVTVSVVEKESAAAGAAAGDVVDTLVEVVDANSVRLTFTTSAAANLYRVTIIGAGANDNAQAQIDIATARLDLLDRVNIPTVEADDPAIPIGTFIVTSSSQVTTDRWVGGWMVLTRPIIVSGMNVVVSAAAVTPGALGRCGIYLDLDVTDSLLDTLIIDAGTYATDSIGERVVMLGTPVTLQPGVYGIVVTGDDTHSVASTGWTVPFGLIGSNVISSTSRRVSTSTLSKIGGGISAVASGLPADLIVVRPTLGSTSTTSQFPALLHYSEA